MARNMNRWYYLYSSTNICKDQDVLAEYLNDREKEVVDIMMTLFEQEYAVERYGDEKRAEGRTEGELNKAKEMAFFTFFRWECRLRRLQKQPNLMLDL